MTSQAQRPEQKHATRASVKISSVDMLHEKEPSAFLHEYSNRKSRRWIDEGHEIGLEKFLTPVILLGNLLNEPLLILQRPVIEQVILQVCNSLHASTL